MKLRTKVLAGLVALAVTGASFGQLIYGNTFPFWNVNGPLVVTGNTTLTGGTNAITGTTTIGAGATLTSPTITGATLTTAGLTSPAITTSITTPSTSFDAFNTTATTLNIGGAATTVAIGAATGTLTVGPAIVGSIATDSTTSTTGAIKTAGGLGVAKAANIGTTLTVTGVATGSTQVTSPIITTSGIMQFPAPRTITSDGAVGATDTWVIGNKAGTLTLTLPDPTTAGNTGRMLCVKTSQAQTVVSASSNVVPLITGAAATAILAATAGKWACMLSDATNWVIMSAN